LLIINTDVAQAFAAANRIQNMRPQESEDLSVSFDRSSLDEDEKRSQGAEIELKNVWFKYPTRDVPVLNGLNMTVRLQFKHRL
jgi:ATP-binding cassette, subfamily B (MDR/TAP), member 1